MRVCKGEVRLVSRLRLMVLRAILKMKNPEVADLAARCEIVRFVMMLNDGIVWKVEELRMRKIVV